MAKYKTHHKMLAFMVLVTGLGLLYLAQNRQDKKKRKTYPNFGISIPGAFSTHGIDVSRYQREIDWQMVSEMRDKGERISFAIIKATEGLYLADPFFRRNWREAARHMPLRGAYLYFHPNRSGVRQAEFFISQVQLENGDLPPVIDIEESNRKNPAEIRQALWECIRRLEKAYGAKPILYTSASFYNHYLGTEFDDYPLWVAHYHQPFAPRVSRPWIMWQHSEKGRVNGIVGNVDFNVVNGSLSALQSLCL